MAVTTRRLEAAGIRRTENGNFRALESFEGAIPGAPTALNATPGNNQVSLSWTAPASDGGSAITDYTVRRRVVS